MRNKTVWVPTTELDKIAFEASKPVNFAIDVNYRIKSVNKTDLIIYLRQVLPCAELRKLAVSVDDVFPRNYKTRIVDSRGDYFGIHLGYWIPRLSTLPKPCSGNSLPGALDWIKNWKHVWKAVSDQYEKYCPALAQQFKDVVPPAMRKFGLFPLMGLNITSGGGFHYDKKDDRTGMCALFPFGNFKGGELHFPHLNVTVNVKQGDIVFFNSFLLNHGNFQWRGTRKSIVLTSHNDFMDRLRMC